MNKQEFIEALKHIEHSAEGYYPNEIVVNDKGRATGIRVLRDGLEFKPQKGITVVCKFDKIKVEKVETSLCIQSINDDHTTGFFVMLRKVNQ